MNKLYCSCGQVNYYSFDKPKFCQKCGGSFAGPVQPKPRVDKPQPVVKQEVTAQDEEVFETPSINSMDVDIVSTPAEQGVSLKDILFDQTGGGNDFERNRPENVNNEKAVKDLMSEASSLKPNNKNHTSNN